MTMSTKPTSEARAIAEPKPFAWAVTDCNRKPIAGPYYGEADARRAADNLVKYGNPPRVGYVLPLYAGEQPHPAAPADAGDAKRVVEAMMNKPLPQEMLDECDREADRFGQYLGCAQESVEDYKIGWRDGVRAAARRLLDAPPGVGERLHDALRDLFAFVTVMHGDEDGNVPAMVRTPIGALAKLGEIMADARAALAAPAPAEPERAKAGECETCAKLPRTRDGVPIVPQMKLWVRDYQDEKEEVEGTWTVSELVVISFAKDEQLRNPDLWWVLASPTGYINGGEKLQVDASRCYSTRAAAEAAPATAASSAAPGVAATGEGGR